MLPGPIFRREASAAARRRELFVARTLLATMLAAAAVAAGMVMFGRVSWHDGRYQSEALVAYAGIVFACAIVIEVFLLALWATATVAPSIAEEREKDTLPLLLLTRLTRVELVATKLAGRLTLSLVMMLTGLPLILGCAWCAGLPALLVCQVLAAVASTTVVAGSLAILASARRDRSATAQGEAIGRMTIWLVGLPLVSRLPARSGTLWGDLLLELQRLAWWIAPSSPASLLTDPSWFSGAAGGALSDRLLTMLAMQAVIVVLAVAGAVAGLRLREPHPTSWDPHRGYRPPVGDDPIFWREYELPMRGGRQPAVLILARRLLIVLRVLLMLVLQVIFLAAAVAVLIGLVIGAGWYGYHAFRECWGLDASPAGTYQARVQLNLYLRAMAFMLGVMPMTGAAAGAASRITIERDKKTWEPLLTTPLAGPEILSSKMRVAARGVWSAGRWLIPLGLLGIVCDAVHPLGAVVAAVGLVLSTRLGLAMGIRAAIKPGATTQSANSAAGSWSLGLMLAGGLMVVAPLTSGREVADLRALDARLPWLAAVVLAAVLMAMAALARSLTRRCFGRFDEWVGRPHRAGGAGRKGGAAAMTGPGPGAAAREAPRTRPAIGVE
jgi:hypothetical protein